MRLAGLWIVLSGCGRLGIDSRSEPMTDLVVSITDDRMAGSPTMASLDELSSGTIGLSLREALTIAGNRAGGDVIGFDPAVFGQATTATAIVVDAPLVVAGDGTALDATNRSVVVTAGPGYGDILLHVTGSDVVIDGLTLAAGGVAVEATGVSGLAMRHLTIHDTTREAIRIDGCTQITIADSRFERTIGDPVWVRASADAHILRNVIMLRAKEGSVHGIYVKDVSHSQISDNLIDPGEAFLINLTDSSDNELIGNILDRGDTGITLFGNSARNKLLRNIVISPNVDSIYVDAPAVNNSIVHTTFFMAPDIVDGGTSTTVANSLFSDEPADFVDPAAYDFHLVPGMTAIDAADDLQLDLLPDVPARFLGKAPDLGAVESY